MTTTADKLDLSLLPPAARREIRDFYQFLMERRGKASKTGPKQSNTHSFSEFCGKLTWKGDAIAAQRKIRDEW